MTDLLLQAAREAQDARRAAQRAFVRAVVEANRAGASVRRIAAAVDMSPTGVFQLLRREKER